MNIAYAPERVKQFIYKLSDDEQFQKIFGEDKVLDELEAKRNEAKDEKQKKQIYNKMDYRVCQLVVDYMIQKKKLVRFLRKMMIGCLHADY